MVKAGCAESVAADDPAALSVVLARLYRDESHRRQLAEAGIRYARSRTWRETAERFVEAFQRLQGRQGQ